MAAQFNADEVFAMAERIERNGAAFYRKAAEARRNDAAGRLFLDLATMEDGHVETFAAMREELSGRERELLAADPDGQTAAYVDEFVRGRVFDLRTSPADRLTGGEETAEILRMAVGLEKDSIAFYAGIRDMVSARGGRDRIEDILREEMTHVVFLNRQMDSAP